MIGKPGGKRRAVWIGAVVLSCLLMLEMTSGCGRKKPPRPLNQDTAQLFVFRVWESMSE